MSKFQYNPIQFNSTRGISPSSYSTAAQNLTKAINNIYEINRKTAPDFSKMAQLQQDINTVLGKTAIEAQAEVTTAGIRTLGDLEKKKQVLKGEQALANGKRAGRLMLYGGGAVMQGIKMATRKPIEKPEPIYQVETTFQMPDSPYKPQIEGMRGQIGEAPPMIDPNDESTWTPYLNGELNGPNTIPQQPGSTPPLQQSPAPQAPATGGSRTPMTKGQYQQILLNNGWSPELAPTMARIGMGESTGKFWTDTVASGLDPQKKNEFSVGAWQINTQAHMDKINARGWGVDDLRDPNKNAQLALEVYREAGGFHPWGAYTNGSYLNY